MQAKIFFDEHDIKIIPALCNHVDVRTTSGRIQIIGITDQEKVYGTFSKIEDAEPNNFIYPFVSNRKVTSLTENVNMETVSKVSGNFTYLNPKIDRLSDPAFLPQHDVYKKACKEILGFNITTTFTKSGKKAVYAVKDVGSIPLLNMGDGVLNILGLVTDLALANNRLFLIEEPENDIHPKALKALMDLVVEASKDNQFIITTHSNIVLRRLGIAEGTKIFTVNNDITDQVPCANVIQLDNAPLTRQAILSDLGYEMSDSDFWEAWIVLEEASAERLIRQYFIPWFTPKLQGRLKTYAAHSISEVPAKFENFNNLFVFLHLTSAYKNKAWVVVDAGEEEKRVIEKLQSTYDASGWEKEHFLQFSEHDFESYYPEHFNTEVETTLAEPDKQKKRAAKKDLLDNVLEWIAEDEGRAKTEFETSAADVISVLKEIEEKLDANRS